MQERAARLGSGGVSADAPLTTARNLSVKSRRVTTPEVQGPRAPYDLSMPRTWSSASATAPGMMKFNVSTPDGHAAGTAMIAPVMLSSAEIATASTRAKTLSGVPFAVLRRTVIDRMVLEGGWVANDMERDIQGRRIYIVIAQSGSGGVARQSWAFYFTEMNGRVYALTTTAPVELAATLAAEAEQVMSSLRTGHVGAVAAKTSL